MWRFLALAQMKNPLPAKYSPELPVATATLDLMQRPILTNSPPKYDGNDEPPG
jgi:hypothetical protein